jgi:transcriptional regulator with XRE-family HTH domain
MRAITSFAHWIRVHRRETGWTQAQLAEAAGISRSYVTALEGGSITLPQTATRRKLHEAFGTNDDELVDLKLLAWDEMGEEYSPLAEMAKIEAAASPLQTNQPIKIPAWIRPQSPGSDERRQAIIGALGTINITQDRLVAFIGLVHAYEYEDADSFDEHFWPPTQDNEVPF